MHWFERNGQYMSSQHLVLQWELTNDDSSPSVSYLAPSRCDACNTTGSALHRASVARRLVAARAVFPLPSRLPCMPCRTNMLHSHIVKTPSEEFKRNIKPYHCWQWFALWAKLPNLFLSLLFLQRHTFTLAALHVLHFPGIQKFYCCWLPAHCWQRM